MADWAYALEHIDRDVAGLLRRRAAAADLPVTELDARGPKPGLNYNVTGNTAYCVLVDVDAASMRQLEKHLFAGIKTVKLDD